MGSSPIIGFSIHLGTVTPTDTGSIPPWVSTGHAIPVLVEPKTSGEPYWSGWALAGDSRATAVASHDGVTVLLAGELYHRAELGSVVGETADGLSDAELLLACWLRYRPSGLRLCNGRFAAVVAENDSVVVATDHAGTIPLYLRTRPDGVDVATEAKVLAEGAGDSFPAPGTEPAPGLTGVRRVQAGTAVTLVPGSTVAEAARTWRPPHHRLIVSPDEAVNRVADVLDKAVRTRLGGPHDPVTAVLSGGIDSSSVVALASGGGRPVRTISLGTDIGDEFAAARVVAEHLGTRHHEFRCSSEELVRQLPWAVAAAEIVDAEVLEYLLPLVVLYRMVPNEGTRIVTGYGADIPLGGMHRTTERLHSLDEVIAFDMGTFDGLNELSPVLGSMAGHWTTHPFWDRDVLDLLTALEPGLKRRDGRDKWVLREAMRELLPTATVTRPKLGIHEGSGTSSAWSQLLRRVGVAESDLASVKTAMAAVFHRRTVREQEPPGEVSFDDVLDEVMSEQNLAVTR